MKWYFAARVRHKEKLVEVFDCLKNKGEEVVSDWVYQKSLKPYSENLEEVQKLATNITEAIKETDIFVLISDLEGTDMFVELGICLARDAGRVKIYIIGEHSKRSLMQLHLAITHVADLKELFEKEKIDYQDLPTLDLS